VDKPLKSVTPDLRLPSWSQSIAALWPVPNNTAWWQGHMGVSNLPRVVAWPCAGRESNPRLLGQESDTLTITPPSHHLGGWLHTRLLDSTVTYKMLINLVRSRRFIYVERGYLVLVVLLS